MVGSGILLYFAISKVVYKQIDRSLITEKTIIQDQIEQSDTIPDFESSFGHSIEVRLLNSKAQKIQIIKDTLVQDSVSGGYLPYRYIFFSSNTSRAKGYIITIYTTLSDNKELLKDVSLYMFFLFLTLFLISILLNYLISRKLWRPFYKSVEKAGNFEIASAKPLDLPGTDIIEFQQLNKVFTRMTQKMRADYLNLKEYNENAAHEIQTPLAIIRSKTDLLMQDQNLKKDSLNLIKSINEATTRLFKLNQGLLLISKIENQYFHDKKIISLKKIVESCLDNYREIMEIKGIMVQFESTDPGLVDMNEVLADVLVSNLLSNAVRYNIDHGFIKCQIDDQYLTVTNSGVPLNVDPDLLFQRFYKGTDNPQSVGLGLSIVKKIVENYHMKIKFTSSVNIHEMKLNYKKDPDQ
jgi:signal transduction histidine kinase